MERKKDMELKSTPMGLTMKAISNLTNIKAKDILRKQMVKAIRDSGRKIRCMDTVSLHGQMADNMRVNSTTI